MQKKDYPKLRSCPFCGGEALLRERYIQEKKHDYQLMKRKLLTFESKRVRHDPERIRSVIEEIIRKKS